MSQSIPHVSHSVQVTGVYFEKKKKKKARYVERDNNWVDV